ncbi:uncharacterized protein LOC125421997 [Ziziphus jujuba]|uniref:Uncharacterized protein LOC125421997 n=1 Tax=Ziziphus jujuba TaxID=326968 RepID=A0ABM3IHA0_ZIZJJ|nr:uncharacterized protein LOC125421997 [Ziziphus jujuba]
MSISRGGLVLVCFGTLFVSLLLIKVAEAEHSEYVDLHTVHREGSEGCKGGSGGPNKGNQCEEDEDVMDVDEDFDDTYKVVNKVKVSLSGIGKMAAEASMIGDDHGDDDEDSDLEHNDRVIILGH